MIAIIDYGMGNIGSICNALEHLGFEYIVTKEENEIFKADKIILPGVGAFPLAMKRIKENGLENVLKRCVNEGKKLLGICLGFQLLFSECTEFGLHNGLGLIPGRIELIPGLDVKIPQIGWNSILFDSKNLLFKGIEQESYVYFVHSYCFKDVFSPYTIASTTYETTFAVAVNKDNVYGLQFHPEKSGEVGLKILKNFGEL